MEAQKRRSRDNEAPVETQTESPMMRPPTPQVNEAPVETQTEPPMTGPPTPQVQDPFAPKEVTPKECEKMIKSIKRNLIETKNTSIVKEVLEKKLTFQIRIQKRENKRLEFHYSNNLPVSRGANYYHSMEVIRKCLEIINGQAAKI